MKKIFAFVSALLLGASFGAFAQDAEVEAEVETPEEEAVISKKQGSVYFEIQDMKVGVYGSMTPALGELGNYVSSSLGGGVAFEMGMPLYIGEDAPEIMNIFKRFGFSAHVSGNSNPVKNDLLSSMWNLQATLGIYVRLDLPVSGLAVVPEVDYGMIMNFPKANPAYGNTLASLYVDQLVQFGIGIRYAPPSLLDRKLEFEVAPTYTLCTEKGNMLQYAGGRVGVLYRIK